MNFHLIILGTFFKFKRDKTDLVGYEELIKFIHKKEIQKIAGDFVEIGTLFGGGAKKIAAFLEKNAPTKKLFVIDPFDLSFDKTKNKHGVSMADFYKTILKNFNGKSQREVFNEITRGYKNIYIIKGDSKKIKISSEKIAFTFIDGNHDSEYVKNDFYLVWEKTSKGGCISFHDYNGNLKDVTKSINELIKHYKEQIKIYEIKNKNIICLIKK